MGKIHYDPGGYVPYCSQRGVTDGSGDIRDVTCFKCLKLITKDLSEALDKIGFNLGSVR